MIRIAVTGPESSGKTTLAKALAQHYSTHEINEFAREYLSARDGKYSQQDLDVIGAEHLHSILGSKETIQIIDTDFIVLKVWSEYRYGNASRLITDLVAKNIFNIHILCTPEIPWEIDALRENPHDREQLFEFYIHQLKENKKEFIIVNGNENQRLKRSIEAIDNLLK